VFHNGGNLGQLLAFAIGPAVIADNTAGVPRLLLLELGLQSF